LLEDEGKGKAPGKPALDWQLSVESELSPVTSSHIGSGINLFTRMYTWSST